MKQIFLRNLLGGVILFALPLLLTSCEDIFGHWEKPIADVYTPTNFKVWNSTTQQWDKIDLSAYDFTKLTPANVATLISGGVLTAGKYIVEGNVNYTGDVMVGGVGKLEFYLQDDASFTINGSLNADDITEGVEIHGQKDGTGKINITATGEGINSQSLTIDGGKLTVEGGTGSDGGNGVVLNNGSGTLTVNGGDLSAKGHGEASNAVKGNIVFNNGRLVAIGGGTAPDISGTWTLAKDTELRNLTTGATARADGGVYTGPHRTSHDGMELRHYY